jgi:hypothetical protein
MSEFGELIAVIALIAVTSVYCGAIAFIADDCGFVCRGGGGVGRTETEPG